MRTNQLATTADGKGSLMLNVPDNGNGALKANEWLTKSLEALCERGGAKSLAAAKAFTESKL